ncbi:hypothetical protein [Kitasatospora terrestris]|uniref:Uncharacterized protein n=1 Tax=Kitasatospora terrestris TaxID=258051 RepID=A0ABP9E4N0_9ACTN
MTDPAAPVRVTVHLTGSDGPQDAPLAHGFLVDARAVLVPDPPETAADPFQRYTVRIVRDGEEGAERLPVAGLRLAALSRDAIRTSAAVLTLAEDSRYGGSVARSTPAALTESLLHHHGDLWAAYAALGYPVAHPPGHATMVGAAEEHWWLESAVEEAGRFAELICCPATSCCHDGPPPSGGA